MRYIKVIILLGLFCFPGQISAQEEIREVAQYDKISVGIGVGLDHGGFGGNLLVYPAKPVGLFVGGGYAFAGLGVNAGVKIRFVSRRDPTPRINPYLIGMYGYNAVIVVFGAAEYNKFFYGPTVGIGIDFPKLFLNSGYWSIALLVPIRGPEAQEYIDDLEQNHGFDFKIGLLPVAISLGYRFFLF